MAGNDQWKMATPSDGLLKGKWWEIFGDPQLNRLEELVNINNQNVKQAEAQFRQARAFVVCQSRQLLSRHRIRRPRITQSDSGKNGGRAGRHQPELFPARNRELGAGSVGPGSSVGRECREQRAGERGRSRKYPAERAGAAGDRLFLAGRARTCSKRCCKTRSKPTRRTCSSPSTASTAALHPGAMSRWRRPSLRARRPRAPNCASRGRSIEHAIAVLTGSRPPRSSIAASKIGAPPPPIPVAVPSQLLERRPDIAANERLVAAANANIGLAETAYYPTLTLLRQPRLAHYQSGESCSPTGAAVGPRARRFRRPCSISAAAELRCEGAQAAYDATVAAYRQTVLSAFQEVEDDLANLRYLAEEAVQQQEAVTAAEQALRSRTGPVQGGNGFLLNVITTQDHRAQRPADRHHHPAAAHDCGRRSGQSPGRRLGRLRTS